MHKRYRLPEPAVTPVCGIDGYLHFLDACAGILIYLILLAKRLFKLAVCIQPEKSLKYEIEYLNRIFIRICDSRVEMTQDRHKDCGAECHKHELDAHNCALHRGECVFRHDNDIELVICYLSRTFQII